MFWEEGGKGRREEGVGEVKANITYYKYIHRMRKVSSHVIIIFCLGEESAAEVSFSICLKSTE